MYCSLSSSTVVNGGAFGLNVVVEKKRVDRMGCIMRQRCK
jgi:hypothetical protein